MAHRAGRRARRGPPLARLTGSLANASSSSLDADLAIVGAGCAGLSLAVHLVLRGLGERTVAVVDSRTRFDRDRTWCFFDVERHPFSSAVTHAWTHWSAVSERREVTRTAPGISYACLPADAFYARALQILEGAPQVRLLLDTPVLGLSDQGGFAEVDTSRGALRAAVVLDSRPPAWSAAGETSYPALLQHFRGWVVRTERPAFDPGRALLMDFRVPQDRGVHFAYVLPTSAHEALVEDTWWSKESFPAEVYEGHLRSYLEGRGVGDFVVTHTESGAIPMTTRPFAARPSRRVLRLGLAAGLARPSTGYAFIRIQRSSAALSEALLAAIPPLRSGGRSPLELAPPPDPPAARARATNWMDAVLLDFLVRHPREAPDLLTALVERVPARVLARFLGDAATLADELVLMGCAPWRLSTFALGQALGLGIPPAARAR